MEDIILSCSFVRHDILLIPPPLIQGCRDIYDRISVLCGGAEQLAYRANTEPII